MRWIAHVLAIAVSEGMVGVLGAGLAVPGPKIRAADGSVLRDARLDRGVDHAVVALSKAGADARVVPLTVARKAELLEDERLVQPAGDGLVCLQIRAHLRGAGLPRPFQVFAVHPAPIQGPNVRGDVVDV